MPSTAYTILSPSLSLSLSLSLCLSVSLHSDGVEALPASRISDIVISSSLSDEDIQQLMDVLLEKMNTNAEWQAVGDNRNLIYTSRSIVYPFRLAPHHCTFVAFCELQLALLEHGCYIANGRLLEAS